MLKGDLWHSLYISTQDSWSPVFLRITCVTPGASAFFTPSVTSVVKKQRKPVEIPSYSTHGYVSSSHIPQSHWKGLTHNVPQYTDSHNDPPASVFRQWPPLPCVCVCLLCRVCVRIPHTCTPSFSHPNYFPSLQVTVGFTDVIFDLWACVCACLYAIIITETRLKSHLKVPYCRCSEIYFLLLL